MCCEDLELEHFIKCNICEYKMCKKCYNNYIELKYNKCPHCRNYIPEIKSRCDNNNLSNNNVNSRDINSSPNVSSWGSRVLSRNRRLLQIQRQQRCRSIILLFYKLLLIMILISLSWGLGFGITNNKKPQYQILNILLGMIILSAIIQFCCYMCLPTRNNYIDEPI